tara:strand:+ start:796 stop:972 length:177 start_codon:yes stop_codon:yes gene_type:complete
MEKRTISNERVRKLSKVAGTSYGVTLPIEFVRELGWQEHQKLTVTLKGNTMIIKDWEK